VKIGPRVWKTGVAVMVALVVCQELNLPSQYLAVIAAMVSIKSSVSQSLLHAVHRSAATVIGGVIGVSMVLLWEPNPVTVGLAIILSILICLQLKMDEAIILTGISVAAVMLGSGESYILIYAGERLLVTLIGLFSGTAINLAFSPPQQENLLQQELDRLNRMLKYFYLYISQRFFDSSSYCQVADEKTEEIRCQFEEVRKIFFDLKEEIGYLSSLDKIKMYEKIISTFYLVFERILGIYQTVNNRSQRKINLDQVTPHYQEIINDSQQLLSVTLGIMNSLSGTEYTEQEVYRFASSYSSQGKNIINKLKSTINAWHLADENRENSTSLMEISTICYEIEQIFCYTVKLQELYEELSQLEKQQRIEKKQKLSHKITGFFKAPYTKR